MAREPEHDLFVSYRHADQAAVAPVVAALRAQGLKVWIDATEIEDFAGITRRIVDGLSRAKALLAWYSARYPESRACQWELTAAYLAAQAEGEPRRRVLVLNPEPGNGHIHPIELRDQLYLTSDTAPDDLARRLAAHVRGLSGALGAIRPVATPRWLPYPAFGSNRFVGRLALMWQVHSALWNSAAPIITHQSAPGLARLVGLGGTGKSLLAEEYALRFGAAFPGGVFWLTAGGPESGTAEQVEQARERRWRDLAERLGVAVKELSLGQVEHALRDALQRAAQPFLWVVDDLPGGTDIRPWAAPHAALGHTLVTTRDRAADALGTLVDVDVLSTAEGLALLTARRRPKSLQERLAAERIVEALGCHAMALDVAGVRLGTTDFATFEAELTHPDSDALELAAQFAGELPNRHEASIAQTLLRSLNTLDVGARDILRLAAVLAPQPIPRDLLRRACAHLDGRDTAAADLAMRQAALASLADPVGDDMLSVHVLVSRTLRFREADEAALQTAAIAALLMEMPRAADIRAHAALRPWTTHARHLTADLGDDLELANLAVWVARFDYERGLFGPTRELDQRVLEVRQRLLGGDHPDTLVAMFNLASTLSGQGDLQGARVLEERGLEVHRRVQGDEHPDTLTAMNNLAETLRGLHDLPGARALHEDVLKIRQRVLGAEHPDTLMSMINLASTHYEQGDLPAAHTLQVAGLEARQRLLGVEHPDTLSAMSNLASTLSARGDLPGARKLREYVLQVRRRREGEEHPDTLTAMSNLATTYALLARFADACGLEERVVSLRRRILGETHPDTLDAADSLAEMRRRASEAGASPIRPWWRTAAARLLGRS